MVEKLLKNTPFDQGFASVTRACYLGGGESERRRDNRKLLFEQVLDVAIEVHRTLGGPGLLESLYEDALFYELRLRNIPALSQVQIPVTYKNFKLRDPMRLDILVDNKVIIEVKATENMSAVHKA